MKSQKTTEPFVPRLPRQIDLADLRSVHFWSRRLGITPQQLERAVKQVGPSVLEVARYLGCSLPAQTSNCDHSAPR